MVTLEHGININIIQSMNFFKLRLNFAMPSTILLYLSPMEHNSEKSKFKILTVHWPTHTQHLFIWHICRQTTAMIIIAVVACLHICQTLIPSFFISIENPNSILNILCTFFLLTLKLFILIIVRQMSQTINPCMVFETNEYISQIYILAGIYVFNN